MRTRQVTHLTLLFSLTLFVLSTVFLLKLSGKHFDDVSPRSRPTHLLFTQAKMFPQGGDNVVFDQPWSLPSQQLVNDMRFFKRTGRSYLVSNFSYSKGLGNLMFQYASLRSIAEARQSTLVVPITTTLRRAFKLDAIFATDEIVTQLLSAANSTFKFTSCCSYVDIPNRTNGRITAVIGYLQNPRYFIPNNEVLIRKQFTFLQPIQQEALHFLQGLAAKRAMERARPLNKNAKPGDEAFEMEPDALLDDLYYVGIHVRRGIDIVMNERNRRHGHVAATANYYRRAMQMVKGERENMVFVVCSDNPSWVKKNLPVQGKGTLFACPGKHREVDMAILTLCDALILSTGTFSWWSGFLNSKAKQIIYYDEWPNPGSELNKMTNKSEFFPSFWTSLS